MDSPNIEELSKELAINQSAIVATENEISQQVADFQSHLTTLREKDTELRATIKAAMEENGVKNFENEYVALTYVKPSVRTTFDSVKFKQENPEVYQKFTKQTDIAGNVRIKVKEIN